MAVVQEVPSCREHIEHLVLPVTVTSLSPANAVVALKARTSVATPAIVASIFFISCPFVSIVVLDSAINLPRFPRKSMPNAEADRAAGRFQASLTLKLLDITATPK